MPLGATEIVVGAIAYFNADILNDDDAVKVSGDPVERPDSVIGNQFVCYKAADGQSWWTPLTGTGRPERLQIKAAWVVNGYGELGDGKVFLQDGKNTYTGPNNSFINAAAQEEPFIAVRPTISETGIKKIVRVIKQRGGQI